MIWLFFIEKSHTFHATQIKSWVAVHFIKFRLNLLSKRTRPHFRAFQGVLMALPLQFPTRNLRSLSWKLPLGPHFRPSLAMLIAHPLGKRKEGGKYLYVFCIFHRALKTNGIKSRRGDRIKNRHFFYPPRECSKLVL